MPTLRAAACCATACHGITALMCWCVCCPCLLPAAALAAVVEACKPGAKIVDICDKGDSLLNE